MCSYICYKSEATINMSAGNLNGAMCIAIRRIFVFAFALTTQDALSCPPR
uniref:Uncharacterized protein n=1 Tax=Arundo donax TaxID=35708 RepID=A0A0A9HZ02_ARUDO